MLAIVLEIETVSGTAGHPIDFDGAHQASRHHSKAEHEHDRSL